MSGRAGPHSVLCGHGLSRERAPCTSARRMRSCCSRQSSRLETSWCPAESLLLGCREAGWSRGGEQTSRSSWFPVMDSVSSGSLEHCSSLPRQLPPPPLRVVIFLPSPQEEKQSHPYSTVLNVNLTFQHGGTVALDRPILNSLNLGRKQD